MRFVTFEPPGQPPGQPPGGGARFGFFAGSETIVDLQGAFAALLAGEMPAARALDLAAEMAPADALAFIQGGAVCLDAARQARTFIEQAGAQARGPGGQRILFPTDQVRLLAPLPRPGKFIAAGKNFSDHLKEMTAGGNHPKNPVAFAQAASTVVGPDSRVPYPPETEKLDYEVEMAVVIGRPAFRVAAEDALDHVFAYTIFNDISARDLYRDEGRTGVPLLGKNLPGFAPMGPALVTPDEVPDPQALGLRCRVNGETRQDSTLANMVFKIADQIAYWSRLGLEPGDVLSTGTPSGVAASRKPGETPWWLKPGDRIEAEVDGLGILRTEIGPPDPAG